MLIFGRATETFDRIDIWHGEIPANLNVAQRARKLLSEDELARADRFRFPELQQKFAQRRAVLRLVLGHYLQLNPQELKFQQNAHGKPFLTEQCNPAKLQFSLSHSKDRMLIAITVAPREIGVDVEVIRNDIDDVGLAESFFAKEDVDCIRCKSDSTIRRRSFFEIWTGKEAYVKAIGQGLSIPLDQFSIDMEAQQPYLRFAMHKANWPLAGPWQFQKLALFADETGCIAYTGNPCEIRFNSLDNFYPIPTV